MMNIIKKLWYRKRIAAHEAKIEQCRRGYEDAMGWGYAMVEACVTARSLWGKFPDAWHKDAAINKRKEARGAKEWAIQQRDELLDVKREYRAFRERVGLEAVEI